MKSIGSSVIQESYDILFPVDVVWGNINGDPDMEGAPRYNPETMKTVLSSMMQKRAVRNYISGPYTDNPVQIYFESGAILNHKHQKAYEKLGFPLPEKTERANKEVQDTVAKILCEENGDIRMFGAALGASKFPASTIRGPVQMFWRSSINPVRLIYNTVTRCCVTTEEDELKIQTMGKNIKIRYGLFLCDCTVSQLDAQTTGMTYDDLNRLIEALDMMFEYERSEMKGLITTQGLVIFQHERGIRNRYAKLHEMIDRVQISCDTDTPESIQNYSIITDARDLPDSVRLYRSDFSVKYWNGLYYPACSLRAAENAEIPMQPREIV